VRTAAFLGVADVVTPEDSDYEQARRLWNGLIDSRPALIARTTDANEVAARSAMRGPRACRSPSAAAATVSPATPAWTAGS
jgi:hypothetical protein